ncbi:hypothetical protein M1M07_22850 [Rhodococcus sp. HM1]|uniref:LGFP repeat-containing protein n=1 Tax=Rhodococcus sp. HM1 TaxID=2937759 RepID=UPI00200A719A|nr:hypothetical protein [Rhodococcus sp. HM1]MCK8673935.1 hypothetical protein [Rhodococcus sp. HM1]
MSGQFREFLNGPIYWSAAGGAHPVVNSFLHRWGIHSYEAGWLKYPTTDEIVLPDGGRRQEFQDGAIYVSFQNAIGSAIRNGPLRDKYNSVGGMAPGGTLLGYPIQDQVGLPDGQGQMDRFERGVVYWHPTHGAHPVTGRILEIWSSAGYEGSEYGYPTTDPAPAPGEPGSEQQNFQFGSMHIKANHSFLGTLVPIADELSFASYDTGLHPPYGPVDLSEYGVEDDPTGGKTQQNTNGYVEVKAYFQLQGEPVSEALWDHFYENNGLDYAVSSSVIDGWSTETTTGYANDNPPASPPATTHAANREDAIAQAIAAADAAGEPRKVIVGTPWVLTGGSLGDHVHALGKYSLASTTSVIAHPGSAGNHQVDLRQQIHVFDIYDFEHWTESTNVARYGSEVGYRGMRLGIAKPFVTYGSGSDQSWSGVR